MTISIKNMVCNRCKMIVSKLLTEQGYNVLSVELGEVKINNSCFAEIEIGKRQLVHSKIDFR